MDSYHLPSESDTDVEAESDAYHQDINTAVQRSLQDVDPNNGVPSNATGGALSSQPHIVLTDDEQQLALAIALSLEEGHNSKTKVGGARSPGNGSSSNTVDGDCPICLDRLRGRGRLIHCPKCVQAFHAICRSQWKRRTCPVCKSR